MMTVEEMEKLIAKLSYSEVGRLHNMTGSELNRRNTEARFAAGEEDGGW